MRPRFKPVAGSNKHGLTSASGRNHTCGGNPSDLDRDYDPGSLRAASAAKPHRASVYLAQIMSDAASTILTGHAGLLRLARSVPSVIHAVILKPKPFFDAIGTTRDLSLINALGFFIIALTLYLVLFALFEQGLIQFAGLETQSVMDSYAEPFDAQGLPGAFALGFLAAVGISAATYLLAIAQWTISIWFFATAFMHDARVASVKAMLVAGLYAGGSIVIVLSIVSLPAYYFDGSFYPEALMATPGTLLYDIARFATATGLQAKYEAIFTYLYLRSVSFTSDLRLHWGLVFTVLLFAAITLVMRVI